MPHQYEYGSEEARATSPTETVTTPKRVKRAEVECSEWVDEWEAALEQLLEAIRKTPLDAMTPERWRDSRSALRRVDKIVDANRSHSSTDGGEPRPN